LPIRQKKYFPTLGAGLGCQEDDADQILDRTQAEVLNAFGKILTFLQVNYIKRSSTL
jgi:hypothetical protein